MKLAMRVIMESVFLIPSKRKHKIIYMKHLALEISQKRYALIFNIAKFNAISVLKIRKIVDLAHNIMRISIMKAIV